MDAVGTIVRAPPSLSIVSGSDLRKCVDSGLIVLVTTAQSGHGPFCSLVVFFSSCLQNEFVPLAPKAVGLRSSLADKMSTRLWFGLPVREAKKA